MELKEFFERYNTQLVKKIEKNLTPLYDPTNPPEEIRVFDERIDELSRKPFPVQREMIKGLAYAMYCKGRNHLFVCGEMGVGKTTIALSIGAISDRKQRILVVCPTHLVEKWCREAKEIIPGVEVIDLSGRDAIRKLFELKRVRKDSPMTHEVFVVSKERAKLGYPWRPAGLLLPKRGFLVCPTCWNALVDEEGYYLSLEDLRKKRHRCKKCGEQLWQADSKLRRYSPSEFIKKYLKGYFDLVIFDEVHDFKAKNSLQGRSMGALLSASNRALCLTGTLNGGYADDLFFLLHRTCPAELKREGFEYSDSHKWMEAYGVLEKVEKMTDEFDNYYGRGRKGGTIVRRAPGIAPVVVGKYLLGRSGFLRLADVVDVLPPYDEEVISIEMDEDLEHHYNHLENTFQDTIQRYGMKALSKMLQALLSYPDSCTVFPENIELDDEVITAPLLSDTGLKPKEEKLIELVKEERGHGRKVLCYLTFTNTRDIRPRLVKILEREGFEVGVLDASVAPKKREAWIRKNARNIDVLLVNAELVKTGLDLCEFPTVVFYQIGYNIFTLRQAARRSWRIGQTEPVKVFFMCYKNTMQEKALALIAKKLEVSLVVEGDLPEGLADYSTSGTSIVRELGNALIESGSFGGAEKAWASLRKKELESQRRIDGSEVFISHNIGSKRHTRDEAIAGLIENSTLSNRVQLSLF